MPDHDSKAQPPRISQRLDYVVRLLKRREANDISDAQEIVKELKAQTEEFEVAAQNLGTAVHDTADTADAVHVAARAFLDDLKQRYPGEELRCPYIRDLAAALVMAEERSTAT